MLIVFAIIAVVAVLVIALVTLGRLTGTLEGQAPTAVYDLDEAVQYVADRLPDDVTATLSYDDVRSLLTWHIEYLERTGVARRQGVDDVAPGPLVVSDDDALAWVLGRAETAGLECSDVWAAQVIAADEAYLDAIGAFGPVVDPDGP